MTTTSPRRRPSRAVLALCSGVAIGAVTLGGVAGAAAPGGGAPSTTSTIINTEDAPVPVKVLNPTATVDIGNLPATQNVSGGVEVLNFPAAQGVTGTVDIGNLPQTQQVTGTVKVDDSTPLKVQSAPAAFEPVIHHVSGGSDRPNAVWSFTVPSDRKAELDMVSLRFAVPSGEQVDSAFVSVGTGGTAIFVPLEKQGSSPTYDFYIGTQQLDAHAAAGERVFVVAGRARTYGTQASMSGSLVTRYTPAG